MVINLVSSAIAAEATSQAQKSSSESSPAVGSKVSSGSATEDTTSLSSGSSVDSLTQAALQPIPTRAEHVEALKQAISQGEYQIDTEQIALALSSADL